MRRSLLLVGLLLSPICFAQGVMATRFPDAIAKAHTVKLLISIEDGGGSSDALKWQHKAEEAFRSWGRFSLVAANASADLVVVIRRGNMTENGSVLAGDANNAAMQNNRLVARDFAVLQVFPGDSDRKDPPIWTESGDATWNALPGVIRKFRKSLEQSSKQ